MQLRVNARRSAPGVRRTPPSAEIVGAVGVGAAVYPRRFRSSLPLSHTRPPDYLARFISLTVSSPATPEPRSSRMAGSGTGTPQSRAPSMHK